MKGDLIRSHKERSHYFLFLEIINQKKNKEACNICFDVGIDATVPSKTSIKKMITNGLRSVFKLLGMYNFAVEPNSCKATIFD